MKGRVQRVGYTRVSTADQNNSRQLEGVSVDKVFRDAASGKDIKRPQLQAAIDYVREGDTLVVHSMDRLARNLDDLRATVQKLTVRGVKVEFVKENLTFTGDDSPMANLLLSMLGAVAQFERELIKERQREGIAIAKAKGNVYRGRQHSLTLEQVKQLRRRLSSGESKAELARELGISRASVYNYLSDEHISVFKAALQKRNQIAHAKNVTIQDAKYLSKFSTVEKALEEKALEKAVSKVRHPQSNKVQSRIGSRRKAMA